MILEGGTPWGLISGKLKFSPEVAKALFGFDMREGEEYIVFRVRSGRQELCHPPRYPCGFQFRYLLPTQKTLSLLTRIVNHPSVYRIWSKLSCSNFMNAHSFFLKENLSRVLKLGWSSLLISKGILPVPKILSCFFVPRKTIILRVVPGCSAPIHIVVLNMRDFTIEYFTSEGKQAQVRLPFRKRWFSYRLPLSVNKKWSHPFVYVFHNSGESFSSSVGVEARSINIKRGLRCLRSVGVVRNTGVHRLV